ncbi:MAG TPA: cell division protein FtsQ/DivIB [Steroidobacteraceae bacterium]|nr:cell division protein FtsQ/DivIB [Steroidobacteraceae bacterium]
MNRRNSRQSRAGGIPRLPRALRRAGWGVAALALAALAAGGLLRLLNQPIERIVITGALQHVSPLDVEKAVRAHLHGAGLVSVNLDEIQRGLAQLPWIDSAAVQRSWPRGLSIDILEQVAVARWNGAGLVNARGELFLPAARFAPPELAQLTGPDGSQQEVTARYLAMQGQLTELGLRLTSLALDERGAWHFTLDDGVTVRLGREQVDARFERFVLAAARLVRARAADIGYVDMRYGNGFAVGWKGTHAASSGHVARTGENSHFNG